MFTTMELSRMPDLAGLQAALDAVAGRHEVLRMRYDERANVMVVGMITPASDFHVPLLVVDVACEDEVASQLQAEAAAPFDLGAGPLLRARIVQRAGQAAVVLVLSMHHAVGDAWSVGLLTRELGQAYAAALVGQQPAWAALPIQYADYAEWQQEQVSGAAGQELREWWRQALAGAPALLQLPLDRPRHTQPTYEAGSVSLDLPPRLVQDVEALAAQLRVNTQAVLLAALQVVLLRYSGQEDVVVGVPVAGRDRPETQGLVGYFINTLPVRCRAVEGATFADVACSTSKAMLDALAHSALPLELVLAATGVARMPGVNPLFQVWVLQSSAISAAH